MSTYYYAGMTAYVKNTPETNFGFRLLAEAIFQLQPYIGIHDEDFSGHKELLASEAFNVIKDNHALFTNPDIAFPADTPEKYQSVELTSECVNELHMTRLHIPIISEDTDELSDMLCLVLVPVLETLFGDNLICVKRRIGCEYDLFELLDETVLVSAERHNVPA